MPLEWVFEAGSVAALGGWVLIAAGAALRPGGAQRRLLTWGGRWVPLLLALTYWVVLITSWHSAPGGNFASLDGVATLFASRGKVLGGWLHFLALTC
jgi:Domain of unknown function (DUF4281)